MSLPAEYFRAGAGAVIVKNRDLVLAFKRTDTDDDAWQCPQGGLNAGEEPLETAYREIAEETGIRRTELKLLGSYPEPLAYELPPDNWSKKSGRGQVHRWYFFEFRGSDNAVNVDSSGEFRAWQWIPFQSLPGSVVGFRKSVYRHLYEWFQENIRESGAENPNNGLPPSGSA
jgi:putative (di)nucleoside polyphosphate hydrolase